MIAQALVDQARAAGLTLACAESCTGGMLAAALTDVPGASAVFDRGVVTYSNAAKMDLLGVRRATLEQYGAVSEEIALEMAEGLRTRSGADIAVSITGVAGPGADGRKPEGMVCFGLSYDGVAMAQTQQFGAPGRQQVREASVAHAIAIITQAIR